MDEKQMIEQMKAGYDKYAKSQGFQLNPNTAVVDNICKALIKNQENHGARYCPCRMITGDKEKDKANICPCIYHKDEIAKDGHCHCNLFVK